MKLGKQTATARKSKVNVGVVGLGFMGVMHLKAYEHVKGARVTAVCDPVRQPVKGVLKDLEATLATPRRSN